MSQSEMPCIHCGAPNPAGAAFCGSCGKALPVSASGPKVLTGNEMPTSAAGAKLVSEELTKQMKSAANTLLAVGILQWILGGGMVWLISSSGRIPQNQLTIMFATIAIL